MSFIREFFAPREQLVALDIGSGNIKMLEIDPWSGKPQLLKLSLVSFKEDIFSNNTIVKQEIVTEAVTSLVADNGLKDQRAIVCVPGPAALIKKIRVTKDNIEAIREQVIAESKSIFPGKISDVMFDFHILGEVEDDKYDIIVVAVKNDVVDSYIDSLREASVATGVVDIDYYAINNAFELNYPELLDDLSAVIDIGSRFSNIILRKGNEVLYAGDASVGGKMLTTQISERFDIDFPTAEAYKYNIDEIDDENLKSEMNIFIEEKVKELAADFTRQLKLFWGSAGTKDPIKHIFVTGGGSLITGLRQNLEAESGTKAFILDPFRGLDVNLDIDNSSLSNLAPLFTVAVGLGVRRAADRIIPQ